MKQRGFTLIEVLVGCAVFVCVALSAYGAFTSLFKLASLNQAYTIAVQLADEQFEIIRNMPYINVGLTNGIPLGILPQTQTLVRGGFTFSVGLTIRNINLSTSTVQASSKLVEVNVVCATCQSFTPVIFTGQVSPANLQSAANGGALVIQVLNASGQPVSDATVTVQSIATSSITDTDVTNESGLLNIIGVSPGTDMYRITVTKSGYSTDRTYAKNSTAGPTPNNPDANVLDQQVTSTSFSIDQLSSLQVSSISPTCTPVGSIHFSLAGSKTLAQTPSTILKYPSTAFVTDGTGMRTLSSMEWDTYSLTPTDASYDIAGINPPSPFVLNPNNSQNVQLVVVPANENSLMVTVEDQVTKVPISGATVELVGNGYDQTYITGEGYMTQTDWSGGSGQSSFTFGQANKYFAGSGVDTSTSTGNIVMNWATSTGYIGTSTLESSTFDVGTSSNFLTLSWKPLNQPSATGPQSVLLQFATKPSSTSTFSTADYLGPDGTHNTYFSVPGSSINAVSNGNEFVRYMAYLATASSTVTPSVSDISFAYSSGCTSPGQVLFQGIGTTGSGYVLNISAPGYQTMSVSGVSIASGWQQQTVMLSQ
ncbi:MAG: prepilin-type N-terminal cleavage/methylation domain-containing protein [Candidatus Taylorbacteria bacterium]